MLQDGLLLSDTSVAANFQIQNGASLPVSGNNTGELFYLTSGTIGLYVYNGITWESVVATVELGGLNVHDSVRVATTVHVATLTGLLEIDGVQLVAGNRVLVKNQSSPVFNGVYVAGTGPWARATDFDGSPSNEVSSGDFMFVSEGTVNSDTGWVMTTNGTIVVGITDLQFSQFTGANAVPGGAQGQLQFNDSSVFTGANRMTYNGTDKLTLGLYSAHGDFTLEAIASVNQAAQISNIVIKGGDYNLTSSVAGSVTIKGGVHSGLGGKGGPVRLLGGVGVYTGGDAIVEGGAGAGESYTNNPGGDAILRGGVGTGTGGGGAIIMQTAATATLAERFRITNSGALAIAGAANYGTSGQVLTSNGNAAPTWSVPAGFSGGTVVNPTTFTSAAPQITLGSAGNLDVGQIIGAAGPGNSGGSGSTGTPITIQGGPNSLSGVAGTGGHVTIIGGTMTGGTSAAMFGGTVFIKGGAQAGSNGAGGNVRIEGGVGLNPGDVLLRTANTDRLSIRGDGSWLVGASAGTSGQVLTSTGASTAPTWQTTVAAQPALTNSYIGYGNGSNVLTGAATFIFNGTDRVQLGSTNAPAYIQSKDGSGVTNAGNLIIHGGTGGNPSGLPGNVTIEGGQSFATVAGGNVFVSGGIANGSGAGGYLAFSTAPTSTLVERFRILANGAWSVGTGGAAYGTSGQVLTSAGPSVAPTWATPVAAPGGSTTQIQYNNAGVLAGTALLTINTTTGAFNLAASAAVAAPGNTTLSLPSSNTTSPGGTFAVNAGAGGTGGGQGGNVTFNAGNTTTGSSAGGAVQITSGSSQVAGGGAINITAAGTGSATPGHLGGGISIVAGSANLTGTIGGTLLLQGGPSGGAGTGGPIVFTTSGSFNTATERFRILANGAWSVGTGGTATGTSGQVLTSTGATTAPTWQSGVTLGGTNVFTSTNTFNNPVTVGTPTLDGHAATKLYVDSAAAGVNAHAAVRAATTANITLSAPQTVDGVAVIAGNRVLVKDQTIGSENGVYVVAAGAWTRATDFDGAPTTEVTAGDLMFVSEGTVNANTSWILITTGTITVGTTAMVFTVFSRAADVLGGAGLLKTANTIDIVTASASRIVVNADSIDLATAGTAGTYKSVTTDAYGRVTAGTNPTTLAGYGITDAVLKTGDTMSGNLVLNNAIYLSGKTSGGTTTRMLGINAGNDIYIGSIDTATGGDWLFTNGVERMRINAGGSVGVGGTAAEYGAGYTSFAVNGSSAGAVIDMQVAGTRSASIFATASEARLDAFSTRPWNFYTGGAQRMSISTTGLVGIGGNASTNRLEVYHAANGIGMRVRNSTTGVELATRNDATTTGLDAGNATGGMTFSMNTVERMRLDATGNLGIGTASPSFQLDVQGTGGNPVAFTRFTNTTSSTSISMQHSRGATVGSNVIVQANDLLGSILFNGANGTGYDTAAIIRAEVDGTPGVTADMPGRLLFLTTPDGSSSPVERLRISSTGAINSTGTFTVANAAPALVVQVTGASQTGSIYFTSSTGQGRWQILKNSTAESGSNAGSDFAIQPFDDAGAGLTTALTITRSNGNVGIGAVPSFKLDVQNTANSATVMRSYNGSSGSSAAAVLVTQTDAATMNIYSNSSTNVAGGTAAVSGLQVTTNTPLAFWTNNTERMRIASDGSTSITTAGTAAAQLNLKRTTETGAYSWMQLSRTDGTRALEVIANSSVAAYGIPVNAAGINAQGANGLHFATADSVRMSILGNGKVLINRTTDSGLGTFQVSGQVDVASTNSSSGYGTGEQNLYLRNTSANAGARGGGIRFDYSNFTGGAAQIDLLNGSSNGDGALSFGVRSGGTIAERMQITGSGVTVTGTVTETSTIRVKENIRPLEGALEKVMGLRGVVYDMKDRSASNQIGLIAEEVFEVVPNVVYRDEEGEIAGVQYARLVAVLIEGMKEQEARIKMLEAKLAKLVD